MSQFLVYLTLDLKKIDSNFINTNLNITLLIIIILFMIFIFNNFYLQSEQNYLFSNSLSRLSEGKIIAFKGFTINPNIATFPFIFVLFIYFYNFGLTKKYYLYLIILTILTIFTYSRGNILLLLPFYLFIFFRFFSLYRFTKLILFLFIISIILFHLNLFDQYISHIQNKFTSDYVNIKRSQIFLSGINLILSNPLGYGYNYFFSMKGYSLENSFLEIGVSFGILPLLILILIIFVKFIVSLTKKDLFIIFVIYNFILINSYNTYILFTIIGCYSALLKLDKFHLNSSNSVKKYHN